MTQEAYWKSLVDRVYRRDERLAENEDRFYRLSCIYGETMVDGVEAYFDRRFGEFDRDMEALAASGFHEVRADFIDAKNLLFGGPSLTKSTVLSVISRLLGEKAEDRELLAALGVIYGRLIERLPEVAAFRDGFGLDCGFYESAK